ncbi:MAG: sulfatase [Planctomycetales bacterium]|nr:sulfatase [Planctomycetales bacterium]
MLAQLRCAFPILILTSLVVSRASAEVETPQRPNVLLILVDDLKPAIGCYGDQVAQTPNLDALAKQGMRFELAYCNQAVCAPSRFTLMLGSHSTSTGLYGLGSQLREVLPDAVTMPQYFAANGYRTESLGKVFHIGHGNHGDPPSFQAPHFHDKVIEYLDPASTDGGKLTREEAYFTNQKLGEIGSLPRGAAFESPAVEDAEYADGRVAAEAVRRLEAARRRRQEDGTPFFMAVGFARPHLPFSAPKRYWDQFDPAQLPLPAYEQLPEGAPAVAGKRGGEINNYRPVPLDNEPMDASLKRQLIHGYYASVAFVDAQVGKLLRAVEQLELNRDTIIVLWGDHGFHLGDLGIWTKHTNYEQACRIPLIVVAPGVARPGGSTRQLAESVDLFPTLAELAGLPRPSGPQPIDGKSLAPVLRDPEQRVRDHAYHAYPKRKLGRAIRTDRYRLVEWRDREGGPAANEYELYDYATDPLERKNLAASQPDVVARLKGILQTYREPVGWEFASGSPRIAGRELTIRAEVASGKEGLHGVVVAQGGDRMGYSLHFLDGKPTFDVRVDGQVTRLQAEPSAGGRVELVATWGAKELSLAVGRNAPVRRPSPGLIPGQPRDGLSIGRDDRSAAGDYVAPHRLNGRVLKVDVRPNGPNGGG